MPRKALTDENANARQKVNKTGSRGVASGSDDKTTKKRKIFLGNSQDAAQRRVFAREVKNIVGGGQQDAKLSVDNRQFGFEYPTLLNQLATSFERLDLHDNDATLQSTTLANGVLYANTDENLLPSTLFSRQAFSSNSSNTCAACKGRRATSSNYDSDTRSSIGSGAMPCFCQHRRYSSSTSNFAKRSSFRSASIISQSTPLLVKTARRSIRPFYPLDDGSELHDRFFLNPESGRTCTRETDISRRDAEPDGTSDQVNAGPSDEDAMSQLASQFGEVTLSPCIGPVSDGLVDSLEEKLDRLSLHSASPRTRLKGRAASFSLGFIPIAFPDEIDISGLRILPSA